MNSSLFWDLERVTELASSLGNSVPELATRSVRLVAVLAARLGSYLFTDLASSFVISLVTEFASRLVSRLIIWVLCCFAAPSRCSVVSWLVDALLCLSTWWCLRRTVRSVKGLHLLVVCNVTGLPLMPPLQCGMNISRYSAVSHWHHIYNEFHKSMINYWVPLTQMPCEQ